jgi:hypothetical protein
MPAEQAVGFALDFDRPAPPPIGPVAPSAAEGASVLTRREREVAVLIARGNWNYHAFGKALYIARYRARFSWLPKVARDVFV